MKGNPSISVYMPTHNRQDMMIRAIESVFAQHVAVEELIVVDDGSSDDTWQRLTELQQQYPKLVCIRSEKAGGACAARNKAIMAAKGEFITGIDDDDEWLPDHIATVVKHWRDGISGVAVTLTNDNGKERRRQGKEYGEITLDALLHYNRIGNQVYTKTEWMQSIEGFDEELPAFQDYDCWVRLVEKFGAVLKLRDSTYILHTSHELGRISSNPARKLKALNHFEAKHKAKFTAAHIKSMRLLRKRINAEPVNLFELFRLINPGNARAAISAFLTTLKSKS